MNSGLQPMPSTTRRYRPGSRNDEKSQFQTGDAVRSRRRDQGRGSFQSETSPTSAVLPVPTFESLIFDPTNSE